jgi:hypothetical protein
MFPLLKFAFIYLLIFLVKRVSSPDIHLPTHPASHTTLQTSSNPYIHFYLILYLPIR